MHRRRDRDAAGFGQGLQPRRDVDAVAVEIAAFDDHIADIDADPEYHGLVGGPGLVRLGHLLLQGDGAEHGIDRAAELHQHAVLRSI